MTNPSEIDRLGLAERLRQHVHHLATEIGERHFAAPGSLEKAADYIDTTFQKAEFAPFFQSFSLTRPPLLSRLRSKKRFGSKPYSFKNVIAHLPGETDQHIVVGAHYDTVFGSPGADDNASGIAVLLEAALLLKKTRLKKGVIFAAFTNEEPPFSRTSAMGSAHFVQNALQKGEKMTFMLCLEMLGFYTDQLHSQSYPPLLKFFYPDQGSFLAVVGNLRSGGYVKRIKKVFKQETNLPVESLMAPRFVRGVDFSDHMNFWARGIPAVMLTDTAFYRNPHYHTPHDLPPTLDFEKMAEATIGVVSSICALGDN